jgi:protein-tyrosine-phosphatase
MHSVLFVCTANICRSPMAMGLWKEKIKDSTDSWKVESAGTWAPEGEPAARNTELVLKKFGIDLSEHLSRQVNLDMLKEFNLILTMEVGHKEALRIEFPEIAKRIFMLSEMVGLLYDISDPMGRPFKEFEETAKDIDDLLTRGYEKISNLAEK